MLRGCRANVSVASMAEVVYIARIMSRVLLAVLLLTPIHLRAEVVEFHAPELDHYFITAGSAEQALVDSGAVGHWERTGKSFAAGGTAQVCRFYGNSAIDPATGMPYGPNSHFYTLDPAECAALRSAYRADAPSWRFEAHDFWSTPPQGGQCSPPQATVLRAYNQGSARGGVPNHRYTTDLGAYFETVARGWAAEGAAMCAPPPPSGCNANELAALEQQMREVLSDLANPVDFNLQLESFDGRAFVYARGASAPTTVYESASTSKWVSAAVILSLVDRGFLSLDSRPQDFIDFWRLPAGHPAQTMTLRHLLAFTSGFSEEPFCLNLPNFDFATCVRNIFEANISRGVPPGREYDYASTHLQIAGLMAVRARAAASWAEIFAEFQARTGLFPTGRYDLPSATNPRLAGGMHWTGAEYLHFLRALTRREVVSDALSAAMLKSQRGDAQVVYSPLQAGLNEDWAYGLGNWVECASPDYNCGLGFLRNSSAGAYGAYPFIDFRDHYFGMLAQQGRPGTGKEGVGLVREIAGHAARWARQQCP